MNVVVNIFDRAARPRLVTPAIGAEGDLCDRSFEGECDVDYILRKYGAAGDGAARFGVTGDFSQVPSDLVDLHNHLADIASQMRDGETVEEFVARIAAADKPVDDKPADDKPADDKPADDKPAESPSDKKE